MKLRNTVLIKQVLGWKDKKYRQSLPYGYSILKTHNPIVASNKIEVWTVAFLDTSGRDIIAFRWCKDCGKFYNGKEQNMCEGSLPLPKLVPIPFTQFYHYSARELIEADNSDKLSLTCLYFEKNKWWHKLLTIGRV